MTSQYWEARRDRLVVLLPLMMAGLALGQTGEFFPVGGNATATYAGGYSYVAEVESLHANWMAVNVGDLSPQGLAAVLDSADERGIKVVLYGVPLDTAGMPMWLPSTGRWRRYEAESDLHVNGEPGESVADARAENGWAWKVDSLDSGWFQTQSVELWPVSGSMEHLAVFRLRGSPPNPDPQETLSVCRIVVCGDTGTGEVVIRDSTLFADGFPDSTVYRDFELRFNIDATYSGWYWFKVWTAPRPGRVLWSDNVEIFDTYADGMLRPRPGQLSGPLWQKVSDAAAGYAQYPAVYRFLLKDEPVPLTFKAWAATNLAINNGSGKWGLSWVACDLKDDTLVYQEFVDATSPAEIYCDCYPLYGRSYWTPDSSIGTPGRVPIDVGPRFQAYLDTMCQIVGLARRAGLSHNPDIPLWFDAQTFSEFWCGDATYQYDTTWNHLNGPDSVALHHECIWREPTPRELSCMIWLALAYGAKGITYWLFPTNYGRWPDPNPTKYFYLLGLLGWSSTGPDGHPAGHRPIFNTMRGITGALRQIGPTLIQLTSTAVGEWTGTQIGFVKEARAEALRPLHFGTFTGPKGKYFIIVNRDCLPDSVRWDTVGLDLPVTGGGDYFLRDEVTGEAIAPCGYGGTSIFRYRVRLDPGQGRLFRVVPFTGSIERNQGQGFSNHPMAALCLEYSNGTDELVDSMLIRRIHSPSGSDTLIDYADSTGWS